MNASAQCRLALLYLTTLKIIEMRLRFLLAAFGQVKDVNVLFGLHRLPLVQVVSVIDADPNWTFHPNGG